MKNPPVPMPVDVLPVPDQRIVLQANECVILPHSEGVEKQIRSFFGQSQHAVSWFGAHIKKNNQSVMILRLDHSALADLSKGHLGQFATYISNGEGGLEPGCPSAVSKMMSKVS